MACLAAEAGWAHAGPAQEQDRSAQGKSRLGCHWLVGIGTVASCFSGLLVAGMIDVWRAPGVFWLQNYSSNKNDSFSS